MTLQEFNNEFDVLYNNIMSNQAPGLDAYEKSVFLTKAQDDVIKSYFSPKSNKLQEGFDDSVRRQIDFSSLMRTVNFESILYVVFAGNEGKDNGTNFSNYKVTVKEPMNPNTIPNKSECEKGFIVDSTDTIREAYLYSPFGAGIFDDRNNTKSVELDPELKIMTILNESVKVERNGQEKNLVVLPLTYQEYNKVMAKPYTRPMKNTAWRLLENSNGTHQMELIIGPGDTLNKYSIRYITRPKPIILEDLPDGLKIDTLSTETPCELDPVLHQDILQRAVELAKVTYLGTLSDQVSIGNISQTDIGAVPSRNDR